MTPTQSCMSLVEKLIKFTILILSFAKLRSPESKNVESLGLGQNLFN